MKYRLLKYPLTSAKSKHSNWKNSSQTNFLVYEIVRRDECDSNDVIKELGDPLYTDGIVERIMAVMEIKKMIPVKKGTFEKINFHEFDISIREERQRKALLEKEYEFCLKIKDGIIKKAG